MTLSFTEENHITSILKALVYIEANLDAPLSLKEISKVAGISPYYFHRLFRQYTSTALMEYIKNVRLRQSAKYLQYSSMTMTDIANTIGYDHLSSFSKAFSQFMGKSPQSYRTALQNQRIHTEQGIMQEMMQKTQYVYREEETVFFLRKIGDYKTTVWQAISEAQQQFSKRHHPTSNSVMIQRCYGMALDDPTITSRAKCRFDLCVVTSSFQPNKRFWGTKKLTKGRYAVLNLSSPFQYLEENVTRLFYTWHKDNPHHLQCKGSFCEYIGLLQNTQYSFNQEVVVKYYIPLSQIG